MTTCHFPSLRCSEWSGWRRVRCVRLPPSSREPTQRQTLASPSRTAAYSLPLTYLKILRARRLCWLECRPELRNHGAGWMRAVERLRNGGEPRHPVFLMRATHCSQGGCGGRGPGLLLKVLAVHFLCTLDTACIMQYLHFLHFARDCISLHYAIFAFGA